LTKFPKSLNFSMLLSSFIKSLPVSVQRVSIFGKRSSLAAGEKEGEITLMVS